MVGKFWTVYLSPMRSRGLLAAFALLSAGALAAQAQDWPQYHIGVGVGEAHLGPDWDSVGTPEHLNPNTSLESTTGWKLVGGFRPVRLVGAEIEYVDFGEAESVDQHGLHYQSTFGWYRLRGGTSATVLTALLFIPEPVPWFDVYGKVGVAKLEETFDIFVWDPQSSAECFPPPAVLPSCTFARQVDETDSHPYAGIGVRLKFQRGWALRLEYEAIDGDVGDETTMFSVGVAWEPEARGLHRGSTTSSLLR